MRKIKRIALLILSTVLALFAFALVGCAEKETNSATPPQQEMQPSVSKEYLTLESYSITLYVDETYTLQVKKYDGNGTETTIKDIEYMSEASKIVSVENGVLTANKAGETYVQIKADGLQTACFVNVQEGSRENGFAIRFVEDCLYNGIPAQAYVYVSENGQKMNFNGKVSWSVEEGGALSVSETGLVLPLAASEASKLKATFTYDGKEYTLEKDVVVEEPYAYTLSSSTVKLAGLKTLSGKDNTLYTQTELSVWRINPLTGENVKLSKDEFDIFVFDEQVAEVSLEEDGKVKLNAKSCGKTIAKASIKGSPRSASVTVEVAIPVQDIADMDLLSLATINDPALLSNSYMMVSDIDYEGAMIYPIAPFRESENRAVGIQWKYLLQTTDEKVKVGSVEFPKYTYVDRGKVGKKVEGQEYCYGLTDEEFKYLAYNKGINSANRAFTGVFDGNGYAIKNAVTMYDSLIVIPANATSAQEYHGVNSCIFGYVVGGTIKNVGFDNIKMQGLNDFTSEDSVYGLNRRFVKGSSYETSKIEDDGMLNAYRGFGIIARPIDTVIQNVYVNVDVSNTTPEMGYKLINGVLQIYGTNNTTSNCVVIVHGETRSNTGVSGSRNPANPVPTTAGTFSNNLVVGLKNFDVYTHPDGQQGKGGNIWCKAESWASLGDVQIAETTENAKSLAEVLASFDVNVWDTAGVSDAPKLKPGCSLLR